MTTPSHPVESEPPVLVAVAGLLWVSTGSVLAWLLWRYVPPHAYLFAALELQPSRTAEFAIALSMWFARLMMPLFVLLIIAIRRASPALVKAFTETGRHRQILAAVLLVLSLAQVSTAIVVVSAMRAGCTSTMAHPQYQEERTAATRFGYPPCPAWQNP